MKTEVELPPTPPAPSHVFPALYWDPETEFVVLFTSAQEGTVVQQGRGRWPVGATSVNWTPCYNTRSWRRLPLGAAVKLFNDS